MAVEPTKDQKWGQQAAAIVTKFPQLAQALSAGGMSADPTSLVGHVKHSSTSAEGFDAMMATFEAYITYLTNKESTEKERASELNDQLLVARADLNERLLAALETKKPDNRRRTTDPDKFTGEEKDPEKRQVAYLNWRSQVARVLATDDHIYSTQFDCIQYAAGRLAGKAYNLFQNRFDKVTLNKNRPELWPWQQKGEESPMTALFRDLGALYATMDLTKTASLAFDKLWMRGKSFPQFIAEFQTLAEQCNKTDAQKVDELKRRVSNELAAALQNQATVPGPNAFAEWVTLFQALWDRQQEGIHFAQLRGSNAANQSHPQPRQQPQAQQQPAPMPAGDPMQLDAGRFNLSSDECRRRGLCFYCKEPGHGIGGCQKRIEADARWGPHQGQDRRQFTPRPQNAPSPRPQQSNQRPQQQQFGQQYVQNWRQNQQNWQQREIQRVRQLDLGGYVAGEVDSNDSYSPTPSATPSVTSSHINAQASQPSQQGKE